MQISRPGWRRRGAPAIKWHDQSGPITTGRARRAALYCLAEIGAESVLSNRDRRALERLIGIKLTDDDPMPIDCCFVIWIAVEASDQQRVMEFFGLTPA